MELEAGRPCELRVEFGKREGALLSGLKIGCLRPTPDDLLERAVAAAAEADAAVLVVGLNAEWETEGSDRVDMELPGRQAELIEKVAAANPRTVVVLNAGSPLHMPWHDRIPEDSVPPCS